MDNKQEVQSESNGNDYIYQIFMLLLSVYILIQLAIVTFFQLSENVAEILNHVDTTLCIVFLLDFLYKLIFVKGRLNYLRWGWLDLISSIPMVNTLRWARFARVFRLLRILRGIRSTKFLLEFAMKKRGEATFLSALFISLLLIVISSIAILEVERGLLGSNIKTGSDALWWAFVTITTVGYGDFYPISSTGRIIAAVLMTAGVGLFGTFTAFVSSWFLKGNGASASNPALLQEMKLLRQELKKNE